MTSFFALEMAGQPLGNISNCREPRQNDRPVELTQEEKLKKEKELREWKEEQEKKEAEDI